MCIALYLWNRKKKQQAARERAGAEGEKPPMPVQAGAQPAYNNAPMPVNGGQYGQGQSPPYQQG